MEELGMDALKMGAEMKYNQGRFDGRMEAVKVLQEYLNKLEASENAHLVALVDGDMEDSIKHAHICDKVMLLKRIQKSILK